MSKNRINELKKVLYDYVFNMCDNEPELDSTDAGTIASAVEHEFELMIMLRLALIKPRHAVSIE
jgi:hypothetical protein